MRGVYLAWGAAALVLSALVHGQASAQNPNIVSCSPGEEQALRRVIGRSFALLERPHSERAYQRLFGSNELIRESVDEILLRIHDGIQVVGAAAEAAAETFPGNNFTFMCSVRQCGDNNAHIEPGSTVIAICPGFFTNLEFAGRGFNGTQVGTIVHEAAHRFIGGTAHFAKTYTGALELAKTSPHQATANPDSYGYLIQEDP